MTLHEIANILLHPTEEISSIEKAIDAYRSILSEITKVNLDAEEQKTNLHLENGMAIGTTWAAMCLDDIIRTKRFIRGLHLAIESLKNEKTEPIHVLYAGTGPYATLLLPILTHYSAHEVKVSLMEINTTSLNNVKQVIENLGFEDHVMNYYLEDATTFQLPAAETIDILISETMQHALQKEQQVPIVYNLVPQLREDALLIPERISLEVAALKMDDLTTQQDMKFVLGEAFELSKDQVVSDLKRQQSFSIEETLQPKTLLLNPFQLDSNTSDSLAILTSIHIFGDQVLSTNESGLTAPKIICPIDEAFSNETIITTGYRIGKENELWVEVR